jgi:hypothetical protein
MSGWPQACCPLNLPTRVHTRRGVVGNKGKRQQEPLTDVGYHPNALRATRQSEHVNGRRAWTLVCTNDCTCNNSIPKKAEERVSQVRGMDITEDSWGVVANRDIRKGDIVTVFGSTTYLQETSREGTEFWQLHERMQQEASQSSIPFMAISQSPATKKCGPSGNPTRRLLSALLMSLKTCAELSAQEETMGLAT